MKVARSMRLFPHQRVKMTSKMKVTGEVLWGRVWRWWVSGSIARCARVPLDLVQNNLRDKHACGCYLSIIYINRYNTHRALAH